MKKQTIGIWVYAFWPLLFICACWMVWGYGAFIDNIEKIGVKPRSVDGIIGILTHPFFHSTHNPNGEVDINHILNNSIPLLVLGFSLFYYFKDASYQIFFWLYIGTGVWLWSFGRPGNHIGASGIVYALFGFILFIGFFKKNKNLLALSLLTIFIYGSMIWGLFPTDEKISWEGHLSGFIIGLVLAFYFRKRGPKNTKTIISDENFMNELRYGKDYWKTPEQLLEEELKNREEFEQEVSAPGFKIVYHYKTKDNE